MVPDGSGGFRFSETPALIDVPIDGLTDTNLNASVAVLADGSYFWTSFSNLIYYIDAQGTLVGYTSGGIVGTHDAAIKYLCKIGNVEYLAYCRADFQRAEIIKIVDGDVFNCLDVGFTSRMAPSGSYPNPNASGDIAVDLSTPVPTLFVLCTNQGIGAYKLTSVVQPDMSGNMEPVWEFPNMSVGSYPVLPDYLWLGVNSTDAAYITRDIALAKAGTQKILYVINAYSPGLLNKFGIYALDAQTGYLIDNGNAGKLSLPAAGLLEQGDQLIWSAATSDDNILLVANTASGGGKFNVYAYESPSAQPSLALSYTVPPGVKLGDYGKISITGNINNHTAKLYVTDNTFTGDDAAGTVRAKVYVFSMKQQGDLVFDNENPLIVSFEAGQSVTGNRTAFQNLCVSALKDGSFLWDDTFFSLRHVDLQGNVKSVIDASQLPERANLGRYIGVDAQGKAYLAYFNYQSGRAEIYSYPQSGLSGDNHCVIANTNSMANRSLFYYKDADDYAYYFPQSIEASGGIAIDIEPDGKPLIYVMSQNRGLGAYRLKDVSIVPAGTPLPKIDASRQAVVYRQGDVLKVKGVDVSSLEIHSITGQQLAVARQQTEISVAGLQGVLLLKIKTTAGKTEVHKLIAR
jgi:hypothetical protein